MSTQQQMPSRYQPSKRVVDDRDRLRELYCKRGLSLREIASEYAEVSRTKVMEAIREHELDTERPSPDCDTSKRNTDRGTDPPMWTDHA